MFVFFYIYREPMHSLHVTGMVCKSDDIIHIHQYSANDKKKTEIICQQFRYIAKIHACNITVALLSHDFRTVIRRTNENNIRKWNEILCLI